MADLAALMDASSPDELHRVLVLHFPAVTAREPFVAATLLKSVHGRNPDQVDDTVVLLATDERWRSAGHLLMPALEKTAVVPEDVLDEVAEVFAHADDALYWTCPAEWFDDGAGLVFEDVRRMDGDGGGAAGGDEATGLDEAACADEPPGPTLARRAVPEGARRWAVARLARRSPGRWSDLLERIADPSANRGAAASVLMGLLDASDVLPEPAARQVETVALRWADGTVRLAALRQVAQRDPAAARTIGERDPSGRVRRWARALSQAPEHDARTEAGAPAEGGPPRRTARPSRSLSLSAAGVEEQRLF
jgi:hypothetical protein